jgi:predicted secreted protein
VNLSLQLQFLCVRFWWTIDWTVLYVSDVDKNKGRASERMTWAVMGIMATDAIWWMMNWTVLYVSDGDKNKGRNKREDDSGCDGTMAMDALTMSRLMRVTVTRTMVGTSIRT